MRILDVPGNLSHRNEDKNVIKMQKIPQIDLSDTVGIYVARFQDTNTFIPDLYTWHLSWYFLPDFNHASGDCEIHIDYLIPRQTTVQTTQISQIC